jgi:hypothetical protein
MSRRMLPVRTGRDGVRANRMALGGRLRSESLIRDFYVQPGEMGIAPTGEPGTSCHVYHPYTNLPGFTFPTDSWDMTSMCAYVVSSGATGFNVPAGWTSLAHDTQSGVEYCLMKVDNMTPGVVNSVGMTLNWSNVGQYVFDDAVLFRWFGGGGGTWSHIQGPVYNGTTQADWTDPGNAVRHCQVIHGTSLYTGYDGANEIGMASSFCGIGHHQNYGSYSGTALDAWQANPRSGHIVWEGIGAFGPGSSRSYALVWSP